LKLKHHILFFCLFAVIATKTYVAINTLLSDSDIELSNELDEEDTDDEEDNEKDTEEDTEEDTEKETSEKDIIYTSIQITCSGTKKNLTPNKAKYYYKNQHYLTPNLQRFFSPPDKLSLS